jgi:hypothetical protein
MQPPHKGGKTRKYRGGYDMKNMGMGMDYQWVIKYIIFYTYKYHTENLELLILYYKVYI